MRKTKWLFVAALGWVMLASAAEPWDPRAFAAKITREDLGEASYKKYLSEAKKRFEEYMRDVPNSDVESFLNDRLANKANEVGDLTSLKKFVAWLALYSAWDIPLPPKASQALLRREDDLRKLSESFSWEKLWELTQEHKK